MPTTGLGIDLIEITRIERALKRHPRLAGRLFTESEVEYSNRKGRPGRHLAARFAAKEAAIKAMSLDPGFSFTDIEVVAGTPPELRFHREVAAAVADRGLSVRVSLTHEREIAGAVAIAEVD
jgi:holo-[acyl-carrier protein] synthase